MGWVVVPRRTPAGNTSGYRVVNAVTRRQVGIAPSKAKALDAVAAINSAWKNQPATQRARREAATRAAVTRRRNQARRRRR